MAPTAKELNDHLLNGGVVRVSTHYHITIYQPKHTGMFLQGTDGNLYVKRGKGKDCLTFAKGEQALVGIALGRKIKH